MQRTIDSSSAGVRRTELKRTLFDNIRNAGEQVMTEIQTELGHSAETLAESLREVMSHWRLWSTIIIVILVAVAIAAACWYCEEARRVCCRLCRRRRRKKGNRRKEERQTNRKDRSEEEKTLPLPS